MSTGHANSPADMLSRLETMVLTGCSFPIEAIRQQIASAIDIMVHLGRLSDKSRRVLDIVELKGYENGAYVMNPLYQFKRTGEGRGRIQGKLTRTEERFENTYKFEMAGIDCGEINRGRQ